MTIFQIPDSKCHFSTEELLPNDYVLLANDYCAAAADNIVTSLPSQKFPRRPSASKTLRMLIAPDVQGDPSGGEPGLG